MDVNLLQHQYDFLQSKKKYALLLGGIGSGKTYAGCLYVIEQVCRYPNAVGFIGANTHKQLTNSTLSALFKILSDAGCEFTYNQMKGTLKIGTATILCSSLDNYEMLRGIEIGWAWLDEMAYMKEDAFKVLMGRLRDKKGAMQIRGTTTPKGFNWVHSWFSPDGENHSPEEFEYFSSRTQNNPHLPDEYIKSLESQFDSKMQLQELGGEFVNIQAGRIAYAFNRDIHVEKVLRTNQPIKIGMDFNVDPMTCTISYVTNDSIMIFDEMFLRDSNTQDIANKITARYGTNNVTIIPDYTGKGRSTTSHTTDHQILEDSGFKVIKRKNPFRMDRYNCINSLFEKKRIIIDPRCKNLIKDLEQLSYKPGTNDPLIEGKDQGHIFDSLGYLAWYAFPLRAKSNNMKIEFF